MLSDREILAVTDPTILPTKRNPQGRGKTLMCHHPREEYQYQSPEETHLSHLQVHSEQQQPKPIAIGDHDCDPTTLFSGAVYQSLYLQL